MDTTTNYMASDDGVDELAVEGEQYLTFGLGSEEYGVEILKVQEIIGYKGFTSLPDVPPWVKGVLNLRGTVVPVIDLRLKFRMPQEDYGKYTVVIILVVQSRTMGIIVDAVSDVVAFAQQEIQAAPVMGSRIRHEFITGMGRKDGQFVILLDIDKLLSLDELDAVHEAIH